MGFKKYRKKPLIIEAQQMNKDFEVKTLEGTMKGKKGDYLIIGIMGERYPCSKEVFDESYELVEKCGECGEMKVKHSMTLDYEPMCKECYEKLKPYLKFNPR